LAHSQHELKRPYQVWAFAQQPLALPQRLTNQPEFAMLQISQPAVDNPRGTAGRARRKIILLEQQRPRSGACALTRNGNAVNAAANYDDLK
jgi:hypothetical protein